MGYVEYQEQPECHERVDGPVACDFGQILPLTTRGSPADKIYACLKASTLCVQVEKFSQTTNMRLQLHNDKQSGQ